MSRALWYELCELLIGISDLIGDESDSVKTQKLFCESCGKSIKIYRGNEPSSRKGSRGAQTVTICLITKLSFNEVL